MRMVYERREKKCRKEEVITQYNGEPALASSLLVGERRRYQYDRKYKLIGEL